MASLPVWPAPTAAPPGSRCRSRRCRTFSPAFPAPSTWSGGSRCHQGSGNHWGTHHATVRYHRLVHFAPNRAWNRMEEKRKNKMGSRYFVSLMSHNLAMVCLVGWSWMLEICRQWHKRERFVSLLYISLSCWELNRECDVGKYESDVVGWHRYSARQDFVACPATIRDFETTHHTYIRTAEIYEYIILWERFEGRVKFNLVFFLWAFFSWSYFQRAKLLSCIASSAKEEYSLPIWLWFLFVLICRYNV